MDTGELDFVASVISIVLFHKPFILISIDSLMIIYSIFLRTGITVPYVLGIAVTQIFTNRT